MNILELVGAGPPGLPQPPGLHYYVITAVLFTFATIWILGAMQLPYVARQKNNLTPRGGEETAINPYKWSRWWWPIILLKTGLTDEAENRRLRGLEFQ